MIATAENVGQTYAMVMTGNADAGFVALSQVLEKQVPNATFTTIPENAHDPIRQDVVLLNAGSQPTALQPFSPSLATSSEAQTLGSVLRYGLSTVKDRHPFLNKSLGRITVVFCPATLPMMCRLQIETVIQVT